MGVVVAVDVAVGAAVVGVSVGVFVGVAVAVGVATLAMLFTQEVQLIVDRLASAGGLSCQLASLPPASRGKGERER